MKLDSSPCLHAQFYVNDGYREIDKAWALFIMLVIFLGCYQATSAQQKMVERKLRLLSCFFCFLMLICYMKLAENGRKKTAFAVLFFLFPYAHMLHETCMKFF